MITHLDLDGIDDYSVSFGLFRLFLGPLQLVLSSYPNIMLLFVLVDFCAFLLQLIVKSLDQFSELQKHKSIWNTVVQNTFI